MSATEEGYEAFKQGKTLDDNPYEEAGSVYSDYAQWQEGWLEAQEDEEEND